MGIQMTTTASFDKHQFALDLLALFANKKPDPSILAFLIGWQMEESGSGPTIGAAFNPLNTTLQKPGSTQFNSVGVQNYPDYQTGLTATYQTLVNGDYPNICTMLVGNNAAMLESANIQGDLSMWVSGVRTPVDVSYVQTILNIASELEGENMSLVTNNGAVVDVAQSNQLVDAQDSQDKCGPAAAAALKYAGLPGKGPAGTASEIEAQEDTWYASVIGPNTPSDTQGSSIDNMHTFLHDAGNLHYWDITAISATSQQSDDLKAIKAALNAGYPVLITAVEQSIISKKLGKCPYPWQPQMDTNNGFEATHIFPLVGVDANGDFIAADQLNAFEPWPQVYEAGPLNVSWATIVQLVGPNAATPWMEAIPSGDPTTWPAGFNAQLFARSTPAPVPAPDPFTVQAEAVWGSFFTGLATLVGEALQKLAGAQSINMPPPPTGTGIYTSWVNEWHADRQRGAATTFEYRVKRAGDGHTLACQEFTNGRCEYDLDAASGQKPDTWYPVSI